MDMRELEITYRLYITQHKSPTSHPVPRETDTLLRPLPAQLEGEQQSPFVERFHAHYLT